MWDVNVRMLNVSFCLFGCLFAGVGSADGYGLMGHVMICLRMLDDMEEDVRKCEEIGLMFKDVGGSGRKWEEV